MKIDWRHNGFIKICGVYIVSLALLNIAVLTTHLYVNIDFFAGILEMINILNFMPFFLASFLTIIVSVVRYKTLDNVDKVFSMLTLLLLVLVLNS